MFFGLRFGSLPTLQLTIKYSPTSDPAVRRVPKRLGWNSVVRPTFTKTNISAIRAKITLLLRKIRNANPPLRVKYKIPKRKS